MELLRRALRNRLGYNSGIYRFASTVLNGASIVVREGLGTFFKLRRLERMPLDKSNPVSVSFRRLEHPILLRPGTQDTSAVINNIVREEYGQFELEEPPQTLIDAGAYIGDTSLYFLNRFPTLQALALEPNPESFGMAEKNLAPYGDRVMLLPYALSSTEEPVYFSGEEMGAGIRKTGKTKVEAITIRKLLEGYPDGRVNILKMDIEGAEDEIFRANPGEWLPYVDCIIVETHGPEIERNVLRALKSNGWSWVYYRNLYYCKPTK
jgi:FkbM family methyltransferase